MKVWRLFALAILVCPHAVHADPPATAPDRAESGNDQRPWYRLKLDQPIPPPHSEHRIGGVLLAADFIHRTGQFQVDGTGALADFALLPSGVVMYLNSEADLRDLPLGTHLQFALYPDEKGGFTHAGELADDYTTLARQGTTCRVDSKPQDGKLVVVRQNLSNNQLDLGRDEQKLDKRTRIWKDDKQVQPSDLVAGDELLMNMGGSAAQGSGYCMEIWVGAETRKHATEEQRKKHVSFIKQRGLPAGIDHVDGKTMTVTLLGDPAFLKALFKDEGIDPSQWATEHRNVRCAVANMNLRTYNPPVDQQDSHILEFQSASTDGFGCSGIRWVIQPNLPLEGFRKGHIVRLFPPAWPMADMPLGEGLYTEMPGAKVEEEDPNQYPYRTDFGNENLSWYQLKPGEFAPYQSHHLVCGELLKSDLEHRSGQFRIDRTGEVVDFTMLPYAYVMHLDAESELADVPIGTHCSFFLHPDSKGAFTQASVMMDDYSALRHERFTYRVESTDLDHGQLLLATQFDLTKDDKDFVVRPPDGGRGEFAVDEKTRVWRGDKQIKLSDLAPGDDLLLNQTGPTTTSRGRCTDIWVGTETHKAITAQQRAKHVASIKEHGIPGWIESVDGKKLTITFFAANRDTFRGLLDGDPQNQSVYLTLADDALKSRGLPIEKMQFRDHLPDPPVEWSYGSSGIHWVVEAEHLPEGYHPGSLLRVFKEGWPMKVVANGDDSHH